MTRPLPYPALVFGSLVRTWNAFAPVALPDEGVRHYAESVVSISRFNLRSALGWERGRAMRIGATGKISYHALNQDRYWLAALSLLADFARYAGIGTLTTMGMGQAKRI
jgi:CRISPR-associated endoribonuclease Cas6